MSLFLVSVLTRNYCSLVAAMLGALVLWSNHLVISVNILQIFILYWMKDDRKTCLRSFSFVYFSILSSKKIKNLVLSGKENRSLFFGGEEFVFLCLFWNCGWSCRIEIISSLCSCGCNSEGPFLLCECEMFLHIWKLLVELYCLLN